jgi:hypothetical protein
MAKHKYIETPEKMWEYFQRYRDEIKSNPIKLVEQKKGNTIIPKNFNGEIKDLDSIVELPLQRPLTLEGFENWCADNEIIADLSQYFANTEQRYTEYQTICSRIRRTIRQDQIEGGMAGIYNASITQRLNNLAEKTENKTQIESTDISKIVKDFLNAGDSETD